MSSSRKILVVGPSWVGDMVMAQSLYKRLRRQDPDCEIHVLAPGWSKPVLERMPEVARTIEQPLGHGEFGLFARRALGRSLRSENYSQAIVLPRSFKSALVPLFAAIPLRTGFRGEMRYGLLNDIREFDETRLDQTVKRFVALGARPGDPELSEIESPRLETTPDQRSATIERFQLDSEADSVALMPGAEYGPAKRWPIDYYADLAARLNRVGIAVRVLGSEKERDLGETIVRATDGDLTRNLCGETSLAEVTDLLSASKAVVTNDSGLLHMAAAVGTQVIALYGSSSPGFTPPLTDAKRVFWLDIDCSPCFQRECPLDHFRCMRDISVDAVCSAVVTTLGGANAEAVRT